MTPTLKAPFPWFGGKSTVAHIVWQAFGDCPNYVEPFAGSLAVLLGRPHTPRIETVNDIDCYIANFWRAMTKDPESVAAHADWPVNEADLSARHLWLVGQKSALAERVAADPEYFCAKIAGWWVWGICSWIGVGWCSGDGPWVEDGGALVKVNGAGLGINRQRPHLGGGSGINRKLPHIGDADTSRARHWIASLADRLRAVRVCCGDWSRVCGASPTLAMGLTGVFLDPPYSAEDRYVVYNHDSTTLVDDVWCWASEAGKNKLMRIAICDYDDRETPAGWTTYAWKATRGYGKKTKNNNNSTRERIFFSPHCLPFARQFTLPL